MNIFNIFRNSILGNNIIVNKDYNMKNNILINKIKIDSYYKIKFYKLNSIN